MSRNPLARFWIHPVQVETYTGQATDGSAAFAPVVQVVGFLDQKSTVVRDRDGVEVLSSTTFYAPADQAVRLVPLSRVALPNRKAEVISVAPQLSGPLGLPDHVVVALT